MSIDLIRALDARATESTKTDSAPAGRGDFPNVLRSELADSGKSEAQAASQDEPSVNSKSDGDGEQTKQANSGDKSQSASAQDVKRSTSNATNSEVEGQTENAEAAVLAAAAAALVLDQQTVRLGDARGEANGRLTDLEAIEIAEENRGRASAGLYAGESSEAIAGGGGLGAAETTALAAAIEGAESSEGALVDGRVASEVVQVAEVGVEAGQVEVSRSNADVEVSRISASDQFDQRESSQSGSEQPPQDDSNQGSASEQTLFDLAATGSQSGGVDPNLRDAITSRAAAEQAPNVVSIQGAGVVANPVAGAVTETTTTGTPGTPLPAAASDAISVQTEWLAGRGGGTARLLLSPPTLGEVAIQVTLRDGVVNVVIVAQEALAQAVAEDQADRLAQAFSNRDLRMDQFEVRRGDPQELSNGNLDEFADSNAKNSEGATDEEGSDRNGRKGASDGDLRRAQDEILIQPQILSAGPEGSVDLRI